MRRDQTFFQITCKLLEKHYLYWLTLHFGYGLKPAVASVRTFLPFSIDIFWTAANLLYLPYKLVSRLPDFFLWFLFFLLFIWCESRDDEEVDDTEEFDELDVEELDVLPESECDVKFEEQLELRDLIPLSLLVSGWPLSIFSFFYCNWIHVLKLFTHVMLRIFFLSNYF